jgi:hypothetical protein
MDEQFKELLALVEGDSKWMDDAAQHCQELASKLRGEERAKLLLMCAVYREKAQAHRDLIARMRQTPSVAR